MWPSRPRSRKNPTIPQTSIRNMFSRRDKPDIGLFQDWYPTPNGKHPKKDGWVNQESDYGTWGNPKSSKESDFENIPKEENFIVLDNELLNADEDYVPESSSSDNESDDTRDYSPKPQASKKRAKPSDDDSGSGGDGDGDKKSVKRCRGFQTDAEIDKLARSIKPEDQEKQGRKGSEWARLLGLANDLIPSDPNLCFRNLKRENREPHALTDISFPPELLTALGQAYADLLSDKKNNYLVYLAVEQNNRAPPYYHIRNAAADLELANEVALARFRDLCHEHVPRIAHEHFGPFGPCSRDGWTRSRRWGMWKFAWYVDEGEKEKGCVSLRATMPYSHLQVGVRVVAREVQGL
ncbi:hypothetical protein F4810DRAFT_675876 [Camillea tinctor]|nr:hypothetical protein F4810DRAFT_675876 [Camillea tinctor]